MQFHRLAPAGFAALVAASSLGAQSTGTVEIGGFGQYSQLDEGDGGINVKNPVGFGFRIGGFMTPRLQLEIDGSYGTGDEDDVPSGRSALEVGVSTLAARLNYNFPFGTTGASSFILGAGAVRTNIKVDLDDDPNTIGGAFGDEGPFSWNYGVSGLAGFRYGFTPTFAIRVDAIGEPALPRHAAARRLDDGSDLALAAAARMSERRDAIFICEVGVGARS